jgi:hypothetical protein
MALLQALQMHLKAPYKVSFLEATILATEWLIRQCTYVHYFRSRLNLKRPGWEFPKLLTQILNNFLNFWP